MRTSRKKTTRRTLVDMRCPACSKPLRGKEDVATLAKPPWEIKKCRSCGVGVKLTAPIYLRNHYFVENKRRVGR